MSWVVIGAKAVWKRHGVVCVERFAELGDEPYIVVEPLGWTGERGWIAKRAINIHLRRLSTVKTCERWLAQLRNPPTQQPPGDLQQRIKRRFSTIELGTPEQLVTALAESYAELYRPDNEDLRLLDQLEASVLVEIACVLGHSIEELRASLRVGPRFAPDAPYSGEIAVRERRAREADDCFATFECKGTLHVTDLDTTSTFVTAAKGTWRARDVGHGMWMVSTRDPEGSATLLVETDGETYPLAILDGDALDDPTIEDELWSALSNDVKGRGAAVFAREPCSVFAWMENDVCFALRVSAREVATEDESNDANDSLAFPKRGQHVLHAGRGVVYVADVTWTDEERPSIEVHVSADGVVVKLPAHGIEKVLRPLVDEIDAEGALAHLHRPMTPRPPGDAAARDHRYRDTISRGTFDEQIEALAHIYAEPHRLGDEEAKTLALLERLILGELAHVTNVAFDELVARVRSRYSRFGPDAPSENDVVEVRDTPAMPDGYRWITTFDVERTLQLTDLTDNTYSLAATPGRWHAAWVDDTIVVFAERTTLPLADGARTIEIAGGRNFAFAVLDAGALQSSVVSNALIEGVHVDVMGRGVAWVRTQEPIEVRIWEIDGMCIAIELSSPGVVSS
jgi:RNA polymerase-interacting CarD/CdnL/TRCF family regulator